MFALEKILISSARYYQPTVRDQEEWTTPGTYYFTVPAGVTKISAVAIGAGGGGAGGINDGGGGGGGALQYLNEISVTAGETLTIVVGTGGAPGAIGTVGGHSGIYRGATQLLRANGGSGGNYATGGAGGQLTVSSTGTVLGTITVQSSNFNQTRDQSQSFITVNGVKINYALPRGHTVAVFNPYTLVLESIRSYDTYGYGSYGLYSALVDIPSYKIVAIGSFDATNFDGTVRNYVNSIFGTTSGSTWGSSRISHIIIGQKNGHLTPYENITGSSTINSGAVNILGTVQLQGGPGGQGGNGSEYYGGNYLCGGGGGAGGYTASGGDGGTGESLSGRLSLGGGGGGGNADDSQSRGGGGTGLHGIGNNGAGNGGGGSSYNAITSVVSSAINSPVDFYPVDLHYAWGNFMNTYAVWDSARGNTSDDFLTYYRTFYAPYTGRYTFEYAADNYMAVYVDGSHVATTTDFGSSASTTFNVSEGLRTLKFIVRNYGGGNWYGNPAGWALTIRNFSGSLLWDTRTNRLANSINTAVKIKAGGTNADGVNGGNWGGGGGGGDYTAGGYGGSGGVRIIWGQNRSYPYRAEDVIPIRIASTLALILHYDAANPSSYSGGSTINDISGNGNHGTISLGYAPASVPQIGSNKVIRFPSFSNTKIDFAANELTSSTITVEMWALIDDFAGGMFFGWNIHDVWTREGTLGFNTGQSDIYGISAARVNQLNLRDRWVHYIFVMNSGNYANNRIYINGVSEPLSQQFTNQYTPYTNFNSGNGRIGGWRLDNNYQQVMDLGIFKIYNRALTESEIVTLYEENKNRFSSPVYYNGLWGRRYNGYFNDNVNYFTGSPVEASAFSQLAFYSSYADQYSWEFKGYFRAPADGQYSFRLYSDDASYLWFGSTAVTGFNTSNALVPHGGLHGPSYSGIYYVNCTAGTYYPIRIQFGENYGQDVIGVIITGPGISGETYGDGYFFHEINDRN